MPNEGGDRGIDWSDVELVAVSEIEKCVISETSSLTIDFKFSEQTYQLIVEAILVGGGEWRATQFISLN